MLEADAHAADHGRRGILIDPHRNSDLFLQQARQPAKLRRAAGQQESGVGQVADQLRVAPLDDAADPLNDPEQGFPQGFPDLLAGDRRLAGDAADRVEAADFGGELDRQGAGAPDVELQLFRRSPADPQRIVEADVLDDRFVEFVPGDPK